MRESDSRMMPADLELTVLAAARGGQGFMAGIAITDDGILALGDQQGAAMIVVGSLDGRDFTARPTAAVRGLRDVLVVADQIWACGERGHLAVTHDRGETWKLHATDTDGCLLGLALASDGAVWVVGEDGYAARVLGERAVQIDLGTQTRLSAAYAVRDEVVMLGFDGQLRRWRNRKLTTVACGATKPLTSMTLTNQGTWIVAGHGGFIARSPDGQWFSRVASGVDVNLEALHTIDDGRLVAVGERGQIVVSADDGRTWHDVPNELGPVHLHSIERWWHGRLDRRARAGLICKLVAFGRPAGQTGGTARSIDRGAARVPRRGCTARGHSGRGLEGSRVAMAWRGCRAACTASETRAVARYAAGGARRATRFLDEERELALPQLATELSPELEALLVGSLVRDDTSTASACTEPTRRTTTTTMTSSPGWDAIDAALAPIYGDDQPLHFGTACRTCSAATIRSTASRSIRAPSRCRTGTSSRTGSPICSSKETEDPDESGFGFELTFRLARAADDDDGRRRGRSTSCRTSAATCSAPATGSRPGHKMGLNGPIALDHDTQDHRDLLRRGSRARRARVGVRQGAVRPDRRHHRRRIQADPGVVDDRAWSTS